MDPDRGGDGSGGGCCCRVGRLSVERVGVVVSSTERLDQEPSDNRLEKGEVEEL